VYELTFQTLDQFIKDPRWFLPVFVVFWLVITGLLSVLGGWYALSKQFQASTAIDGQRFRFASGSFGRYPFPVTAYGNCLFVTVADTGFRIAILLPFRFLSPPIFVPWEAVDAVEPKSFLLFKYCVIRLRRGWPSIAIRGTASGAIADMFARHATA
jgi:hypothetical protein